MSTHDNSTDNGYGRQGGYPEPARDGHTEQHSAASAQDSSAADGSSTAHDSSQSGASSPHARYAPPSIQPPRRSIQPASQSGTPYTGVPATPAGYDFSRASSRPAATGGSTAPYGSSAPAYGHSAPGASAASGAAAGAYAASSQPQQAYGAYNAATQDRGQERRGPGWGALVGATVVAAVLGSGGAFAAIKATDSGQPSSAVASTAPTAIATGDTTQTVNSQGQTPDWEGVTAAVSNAVVAITVEVDGKQGEGSGFIYDKDGHILTNDHVVSGASQVAVSLADGRIYEAEITGTDPATDLAVIQLVDAPDDLTVVQLGDSDALVTGQDVMAIGNPLGLSSTATTGIVSALNRPVVTGEGQSSGNDNRVYTNAIQIDAAVNPGNSGGPLFDEKGHVVGITSSIISTSEDNPGSIGIGFAIPVNLAEKVAKQLIESGSATHAYLGVGLENGLGEVDGETRGGAKVTNVESGAPADKAGLKTGDIIVAIDDKPTSQANALTGFVRQYSAGETIKLTVIRDGEQKDVEATLVERPDS